MQEQRKKKYGRLGLKERARWNHIMVDGARLGPYIREQTKPYTTRDEEKRRQGFTNIETMCLSG